MLGCLIPGPFPEYTRGGEYTGGWVYQGGGVGYQEEGRNGYTRRRGGIGYARYTHPRWYTPWYWHLVVATEAGGTHPTGMLTCSMTDFTQVYGFVTDAFFSWCWLQTTAPTFVVDFCTTFYLSTFYSKHERNYLSVGICRDPLINTFEWPKGTRTFFGCYLYSKEYRKLLKGDLYHYLALQPNINYRLITNDKAQ